ncbi:MAG: fold metallo-hydrolase [Cytophagaceae bacterium]|jgi:glyoxylase-like metal-dependent hydrolase (beta-lactamase superfamily II)/rhodanese-related sulfurtransferase|nr:fold metallo-hydrolase [Cytophagaceae bacterium]
MKVEQIYTGCLAQGAYYIVSEGEAVIIDPLREIKPYLDRAKKDGVKIKYIFETHFHADFVSGHIDLAKATGATIVYGPTAKTAFESYQAKDGEVFALGKIKLKVLHTPGHTLESVCYLLMDEEGKDHSVFTGDTLFIGDVGRPDLAQKAAHKTQDELAGILYDSLRTKLMTLADEVLVYPAHGAGSACGKHMSKETVSTIGAQKDSNYALRSDMTKEEFIQEVTKDLLPAPAYFPENVKMNKQGPENIEKVLKRANHPLSPDDFERLANETGALVLDTRSALKFAESFIPNAINIGIDGGFAPWVGALIPDILQPILLITEEGKEEEVATRLARVGYDHAIGYLSGGMEAWVAAGKETDQVDHITAQDFAADASDKKVIDVRTAEEFGKGHLSNVENIPLDGLSNELSHLSKEEKIYVHCAGGYRSMIAASILKARGFDQVVNIEGGYQALEKIDK